MNELTFGVEADEAIPYSIIENYIFDIEGLSANKKLFILMLRRYTGADRKPAYPSYTRLMKDIGVSKRSLITKNIDFFEWLKWLEKEPRNNPNGEKTSNLYIIKISNIKMVLEHFKKKGYSFKEIEKYFEAEYKDKGKKLLLLSKPCKYFE